VFSCLDNGERSGSDFYIAGINREVLALHGDRAPPVSIIDSGKTYKAKFQRDFKPSHWEAASFINSARSDGLQLRHWRKQPARKLSASNGEPNGENFENHNPQSADAQQCYSFAKYNVEITVPTYTDTQYDEYLRSDDWSKEETDYLLNLVKEYYLKWPIIIDRYDFKPKDEPIPTIEDPSTAIAKTSDHKGRTLEQLKARFYEVWRKNIEISAGGEKNMSEAEFSLHEALSKYDPQKEETRKSLAWQLCNRTVEEVREEEFLLSELQRIMISAQKFEAERAEVRARLEIVKSHTNGQNTYQYNSLNTLNGLYAQLMAQDRNRKARHRLSLNAADMIPSPASALNATPASAAGHRDSMGGSGQKKGAVTLQTPIRQLSPRREARFGVTTHDRLTSGVTFRSDKLLKLRQAKSQIQTQKIATVLIELEIPEIIVLPTDNVMSAFEGLIQRITKLVEARKVLEKEEGELRIAVNISTEKAKQERGESGKPDAEGDISVSNVADTVDGNKNREEDGEADAEGEQDDVDGEADEEAEPDEDAEGGDEDAEGEADADGEVDEDEVKADAQELAEDEVERLRPSSSRSNAVSIPRGHKRSASVLSAASSRASSKRSRRR